MHSVLLPPWRRVSNIIRLLLHFVWRFHGYVTHFMLGLYAKWSVLKNWVLKMPSMFVVIVFKVTHLWGSLHAQVVYKPYTRNHKWRLCKFLYHKQCGLDRWGHERLCNNCSQHHRPQSLVHYHMVGYFVHSFQVVDKIWSQFPFNLMDLDNRSYSKHTTDSKYLACNLLTFLFIL